MTTILATVFGSLIAAVLAAVAFNFLGDRLGRRERDASEKYKTA